MTSQISFGNINERKRVCGEKTWRFSSVGRASALQAEGQRFDPVNSHRSRGVAVITSPCHGEDRGFDSRRDRQVEIFETR